MIEELKLLNFYSHLCSSKESVSLRPLLFVFLLLGFSWSTEVGSWHARTQAFKSYWVYFVVFRPTVAHISHNLVEEKHNARFLKRLCAAADKK